MQKIFTVFAIIVCLLSLGLVFLWSPSSKDLRPPKPVGHMDQAIPMTFGKWKGQEKPLAETDEVLRATESLLAVNEFLNRTYRASNGEEFTLYISYWAQGKEPTVKAASHIPDNCWVRSGWTNIEEAKAYGEEIKLDGKYFQPLYSRKFGVKTNRNNMVYRYVWYWFLVEGKSYDFGSGDLAIPSPVNYVKNMIRESREGIPEQYFIRIDSDKPLSELYEDEDFKDLLKSLGNFILYKQNEIAQENK